jgi:hypothetical protein
VAKNVPGAKTVMTPDVQRVTLVLGSDGRWVKGVAQAPAKGTGGSGAGKAKSAADPTGGLGCID